MDRAERAARQWAHEYPDLETGPMVLLGRLGEAAQVIARDRLNPLFARFGLQPGEFDVLATLRRSGAPYALTPTALYEAAMISSGSMTNRIDRLEKVGLVERRPNPDDRRGTLVALTGQGKDLIERAVAAHIENQKEVVSTLSRSEQDLLCALLAKLASLESLR
jgi:DNA-binding MarR family transcriptional regulator